MKFLWDPIKAENNIKKHGVSFEEAMSAFLDTYARRAYDSEHSTSREDRWILLAMSQLARLLVVVHIELNQSTLRIISARKATKKEMKTYMELRV